MWRRGAVLVALAMIAGSVPALASTTPADPVLAGTRHGRVTRTWSLDDGAFTAAPAARGSKPKMSEAQAIRLARAANPDLLGGSAGTLETLVVGYGLVTVKSTVKHDTESVPRVSGKPVFATFQRRPAWIVADVFDGVTSCPGLPEAPQPIYPTVPTFNYDVLAIDAVTGHSAIDFHESGNDPCDHKPHPATVSIPLLSYSIPFTRETAKATNGDALLNFVVPACADEFSEGGGGAGDTATIQIVVLEPFNTPAHCKPAFTDSIDYGHGFQHFIQAPLGLLTRNGTVGPPKPVTADL